jgi:hypothetical protein
VISIFGGNREGAVSLLRQMIDEWHLQPDTITMNSVINAFAQAGDTEGPAHSLRLTRNCRCFISCLLSPLMDTNYRRRQLAESNGRGVDFEAQCHHNVVGHQRLLPHWRQGTRRLLICVWAIKPMLFGVAFLTTVPFRCLEIPYRTERCFGSIK